MRIIARPYRSRAREQGVESAQIKGLHRFLDGRVHEPWLSPSFSQLSTRGAHKKDSQGRIGDVMSKRPGQKEQAREDQISHQSGC
ncbi:MAG: hypothetical protein ABW164_01545, partial [Sphingobium sp.]